MQVDIFGLQTANAAYMRKSFFGIAVLLVAAVGVAPVAYEEHVAFL